MEYSSLNSAFIDIPTLAVLSIKKRYTEPHRMYHTLTHIHDMMKIAFEVDNQINDKLAVVLAILAHDCVYKTDDTYHLNEVESAKVLEETLTKISPIFSEDHVDSIDFAKKLI